MNNFSHTRFTEACKELLFSSFLRISYHLFIYVVYLGRISYNFVKYSARIYYSIILLAVLLYNSVEEIWIVLQMSRYVRVISDMLSYNSVDMILNLHGFSGSKFPPQNLLFRGWFTFITTWLLMKFAFVLVVSLCLKNTYLFNIPTYWY